MKNRLNCLFLITPAARFALVLQLLPWLTSAQAQPDPNWLDHDRLRPAPALINPGTFSSQEQPGQPPSDATILFDGKDLSSWVAMDGKPTKWVVRNGAMECV